MKNFSLKTKENYLRNSKAKPFLRYVFWVCGAFCVLFLLKGFVGAVSTTFTTPLYSLQNYIHNSSDAVPFFIRDRLSLLTDMRALEEQIASQKSMEETVAFLTAENETLRDLGSISSTSPRIIAGVIARPPYTPYDTLIIDRGSEDGIVLHAPVYLSGGVAIGYVREVYSDTALVVLFSSPGVESTVFVFGPNLFTTAYGEGGGVIRLSIPQGITAEKGDVVILPSLDTGVIGSIHDLISNPTEPEQKAYVSSEVSLQSLRLVGVGTTPVKPVVFNTAMEIVREEEKRLFMIEVPPDVSMQMGSGTPSVVSEGSLGSTTATTTSE